MLIEQDSITSQQFGFGDVWRIANSVLNKCKSAIPPLFNGPLYTSSIQRSSIYLLYSTAKVFCLLHLMKQNCLLKTFLGTLNLDDSGISSPVFPCRTNLKLHISVTPTLVEMVITNLDLSKASGPDWIPVVVIKNFEPERTS